MKSRKFDPERLGKELAEYGSLHDIIESLKRQMDSLHPEVENLEKQKAKLVSEVNTLTNKRNALLKEIDDLNITNHARSSLLQSLRAKNEDLINSRDRLGKEMLGLQSQETGLRQHNEELMSKQKAVEEKLEVLPEINRQFEEKTRALNDIESKIKKFGTRFDFFESFLAFIKANSIDEVEKFFNSAPRFIDTVKEGNFNIEAVKGVIYDKFAGGILDVMICGTCAAEFVVVKKPSLLGVLPLTPAKTKPGHCPMCGSSIIRVIKPSSATLGQELKKNK